MKESINSRAFLNSDALLSYSNCKSVKNKLIKGVFVKDYDSGMTKIYLVEERDSANAIEVLFAEGIQVYPQPNDYDYSPTGLWFCDGIIHNEVVYNHSLGLWMIPVRWTHDI